MTAADSGIPIRVVTPTFPLARRAGVGQARSDRGRSAAKPSYEPDRVPEVRAAFLRKESQGGAISNA
jgi:hypothetical protein